MAISIITQAKLPCGLQFFNAIFDIVVSMCSDQSVTFGFSWQVCLAMLMLNQCNLKVS